MTYSEGGVGFDDREDGGDDSKIAASPWLIEFQSSSARVYFGMRIDIKIL